MNTLRLWDGTTKGNVELAGDVRKAQKALGIKIDGYFGVITEAHVMAFQRNNGLVDDGVIGPITWSKLAPVKKFPGTQDSLNEYLSKYREIAVEACGKYGVIENVIFAIGWRESRWGLILKADLTGDCIKRAPNAFRPGPLPPDGLCYGRGLMQVDYDAHPFARTGNWRDPKANINYGCKVLKGMVDHFNKRKFDSYSSTVRLRFAIAAYNCGPRRVEQTITGARDIDYFTHGRDYSANILEVARYFQDTMNTRN